MSPREITKGDLLRWVDDLVDLDAEATIIVTKLAAFADEECCGWAKVETLAKAARCSVRTAQYRLRVLIERGYIRDTGQRHRLKDSTRSVPVYLVGPLAEAVDNPSMGAEAAPIEPEYGCKTDGGMGAAACTPKEPKEPSRSSDELLTRARETDFDRLEAAYPRLGLGFTDRSMARRAFVDLVGGGADPAALIAAAAAYAADPVLKRRDYGPVGLHRWLSEGRYRAWTPSAREDAPAAKSPARTPFAGPAEVAEELVAAAPSAAACLVGAGWREADRTVLAPSGWAATELERRVGSRRLRELQINIERAPAA